MNGVSRQQIEQALLDRLGPPADGESVEVIDESRLHAGHAGAGIGTHWRLRIVSARFTGLSRVARHRLVYDSLKALIAQGIHALAIEASAPGQA